MLLQACVGHRCYHTIMTMHAQVFVTCGSAQKCAFLLAAFSRLREDHIGDSHSCSFEGLIRSQTGGAGVHLALNSLTEEKLQVRTFLSCPEACTPR